MIDFKDTFKRTSDKTAEALTGHFPIKGKTNTLVLKDVQVKPPEYDLDKEEDAKYNGKTLATNVTGHVQLVNNETGQVVDEKKGFSLMKLPTYTSRGTFIIGGQEYNVSMQNRRRAGVYPVRRDTGEIESEFNLSTGKNMTMKLDSKSGKFKMQVDGANKDLYPILRSVGITEEQLIDRWGYDVLTANKPKTKKSYDTTILDTARRLTGTTFTDVAKAGEALRERLASSLMSKDVNRRTIGLDHDHIQPETLVKTSLNMLAINRGEAKPVDRNALHFKSIHGIEDYVPERINLHARKLGRRLKRKVDDDKTFKVSDILTSGMFSGPVEKLFKSESFIERASQYNPIDMLSQAHKVTALGKGGITSLDVIRDDMRALHNTQAGFFDPIQTPESEKIGVNVHLSAGAVKRGNKLYTKLYNTKKKKQEEVAHTDTDNVTIALPGRNWDRAKGKFKTPTVRAFRNGEMVEVKSKDVDYVHEMPQNIFSLATNMIPFMNSNSGARLFMASKQIGQAISLKDREKPLVLAGKGSVAFEKFIGNQQNTTSRMAGTVSEVNDKYVIVKDDKGVEHRTPIYKNFPLNDKNFLHTEQVLVKPGDRVRKGTALMDNNFTKDGTLSVGTNLRTAYMSDGGYNFEDGITISASAAKKLTSQHLYNHELKREEGMEFNPKKFVAHFPQKITKTQAKKVDQNGVILEGMTVEKGDPLIIGMRKADLDASNMTLKQLGRNLQKPYRDVSTYWENENPGVVTKVVHGKKGTKVYVKSESPAVIADKLAGRYGNKGVITRILDDKDMPRDKDGNSMDILLNPATVPSRMNPGQLMETALGKVAMKTGKPIIVESFADHDNQQYVRNILKKNGFKDDGTEKIFDKDGNELGDLMTGYQYTLKLSKMAKTGFSARSAGPGEKYDVHNAPTAGSKGGAKAMDVLSMYAMLAHGANNNLREMATDKASSDHEFWRLVKNGLMLPSPKPTFVYDKFTNYLKGSGVNMTRKGSSIHMTPMTDDEITKLSRGEITKGKFIQAKNLKSIKGGLLDDRITGGLRGDKWSHVNLAEPVLNPLFKGGVREILGVTDNQLMDTISTEGSSGIIKMLEDVDLEKMEKDVANQLKIKTKPDIISKLNKRLKYIRALKKFEMNPTKAYTLTKFPVIPPNMRPISQMEGGSQNVSSINWMYRDLLLTNNTLKKVNEIPYIPNRAKGRIRTGLQQSVEAISGISGPISTKHAAAPQGFVEQLKGKRAKEGFFQRRVLRRTQDITGRGVITPDPKLGVDEVALPEDMAWKIYDPFIERKLRQRGYTYDQILDMKEKRTKTAMNVLQEEMKERPVMLNRPPTLHKFGFLGFKPKLSNGQTIKIPSLVVTGFGADFDGDAMMVHVPVRKEAIAEINDKLMVSKNLFNPRSDDPVLVPSKGATTGIWRASKTADGLKRLKEIVPKEYHHLVVPGMDKGKVNGLLKEIGVNEPTIYPKVAQSIKLLGDEVSNRTGLTINLSDLKINDPELGSLRKEMWTKVRAAGKNKDKVNEVLGYYNGKISDVLKRHSMDNNLVQLSMSGGAGSNNQIKQMIGAGVQYTDANKKPMPIMIDGNYGEGMGINDYWTSLHSARRGMIDRKMETADPGAFAKNVLINTSKQVITSDDPLDDDGEEFTITDKDAHNRYIAADIIGKDGKVVAKKGSVLTPKTAARAMANGVKSTKVHTVLSGSTPNGINAKSYGVFVEGKTPQVGDNIGALAGQALGEPLQQGAMKTFHTGGSVATGAAKRGEEHTLESVKGYEVVQKIINLPKIIPNSTTLSTLNGKVEDIQPHPAGGHIMTISGKKHFIKAGLPINVKKGQELKKGDPLSMGFVHPRELLETTGDMMRVRKYMVEQLRENFEITGKKINRRNLEVVVKSLTDTATIKDPGDTDFIKGDIISYDYARWHNNRPPYDAKPDADVLGKILAKPIGDYPRGAEVDEAMLDNLQNDGVESISCRNKKIKFTPTLLGAPQIPQKTGDLFTNMLGGYIQKGILGRLPAGEVIPLHGTSPVASYAYGAEFGKGPTKGTY